jgi:large subunit ribosomal protein L18
MSVDNLERRARRKLRIRKHVTGTAERPRLTVFRSSKHIYAQVIDDAESRSLAAASTLTKALAEELAEKTKTECAQVVGAAIAKICLERGITKVVFDRNGYDYHGRVSALAQAARDAGLDF